MDIKTLIIHLMLLTISVNGYFVEPESMIIASKASFLAMDAKTGLVITCLLGSIGFNPTVVLEFTRNRIVPDVIDRAPKVLLSVTYDGGLTVNLGTILTPTQVMKQPTVTWIACPTDFYTLIMLDADVPSVTDHSLSGWFHWVVVNIPGNNIAGGETLDAFISSGPGMGSGNHRYMFLLFKQKRHQIFTEPRLNNTSAAGRSNQSVRLFAATHGLGFPIAGNFYLCAYDSYVPTLLHSIGLA